VQSDQQEKRVGIVSRRQSRGGVLDVESIAGHTRMVAEGVEQLQARRGRKPVKNLSERQSVVSRLAEEAGQHFGWIDACGPVVPIIMDACGKWALSGKDGGSGRIAECRRAEGIGEGDPHGCEAVHVRGLQLNPEERADCLDVDQVIDGDGKYVAAHGVQASLVSRV
jgi:hypothetical protein